MIVWPSTSATTKSIPVFTGLARLNNLLRNCVVSLTVHLSEGRYDESSLLRDAFDEDRHQGQGKTGLPKGDSPHTKLQLLEGVISSLQPAFTVVIARSCFWQYSRC
jgi:hypothetical protein